MRGRILVARLSLDFSSTNLATGSDTAALTLTKPDGTTSTTMPANVAAIVVRNTASDGVIVRSGGTDVALIGETVVGQQYPCVISSGTAITMRSVFGAVSSGKVHISFYN